MKVSPRSFIHLRHIWSRIVSNNTKEYFSLKCAIGPTAMRIIFLAKEKQCLKGKHKHCLVRYSNKYGTI